MIDTTTRPPIDLSATLAFWREECWRQLATDPELIMRQDFAHTRPWEIHTLTARPERGTIITDDEAERLACQAEVARMAMGDLQPSAPMPLTDQERGEALGNLFGWPLAIIAVVAVVAAAVRVWQ